MADIKAFKLLLVIAGSFTCAALLGELTSFIIGLITPDSWIYIAWISNGFVTAYLSLLLGSIGFIFVYTSEKESNSEDFIRNQENSQSIVAVFALIISFATLINTSLVSNEKRLIVSTSVIVTIITLFVLGRARLVRNNRLEKKKAALKDRISNSLLIQALASVQLELQSSLNWQDRQRLKLHLVWLESLCI